MKYNNNIYISVIIPMYNVEQYIEMCINSVLGQTFKDFEIIVVDDCSTDNSYDIVNKLYGDNDKIRVFRNSSNLGAGMSRNIGIENARGEYVYFVDSDDFISANTLEILSNAAKSADADVIHMSKWYRMYGDSSDPNNLNKATFQLMSEPTQSSMFLESEIVPRLVNNLLRNQTYVLPFLSMFKKSFLNDNNIKFQAIIAEDEVFHVEALMFAKNYYKISAALYINRRHEGSIMTGRSLQKATNSINSMIVGSRHLKKVMVNSGIPSLIDNSALQTDIIYNFLGRIFYHYIRPYYESGNISADLDSAIDKALIPQFEQDNIFIKYLIHNYNLLKLSNDELVRQVQILQQQLNQ